MVSETKKRYDDILSQSYQTGVRDNSTARYRTMMRSLDLSMPSGGTAAKGRVVQAPASSSEYLKIKKLRAML